MPNVPPDDQFKLRRWMQNQREIRKQAQFLDNPMLLLPKPAPHYHILYNTRPDATIGYETVGLVMRAIKALADKHEDAVGEGKVIYYDDLGAIQLVEANIRGRTGKFNIMVQPGECHSRRCRNIAKVMTKEDRQ